MADLFHSLGVALFVGCTLLALSKSPVWWVRGADFPRAQFAVIGMFLIGVSLYRLDANKALDWVLLIAATAALLYQAWWIVPYTRLFRPEVPAARKVRANDRLRILSVNVLMTNSRTDLLIDLVRQEKPDVLVTLETNQAWEEALRPLEKTFPYQQRCPLENLYGMHVYSRLPIEDARTQFLVEPDVPSMHLLVVLRSGRKVALHSIHPAPPSPTENPTSEERDAELVMVGRSVVHARYPVVVTGDLNDVAWSRTTRLFRKVSRLLDPRVGRGMYSTFHAKHAWCRWPVDHFFVSREFTLVELKRLGSIGSDHFPVLMELQCEPDTALSREGLDKSHEDDAEANEQLAKQNADAKAVHRPGE